MTWKDALARIKPASLDKVTNRDAAGLISFARSAYKRYQQKYALTPFDWYSYALPALGWYEKGDKFAINAKRQAMTYPVAELLWVALDRFADELDKQGQPFEMVTNPVGTDAKFKQLATDAWDVMKREGSAEGSSRDAETARQVDIVVEAGKHHDILPSFTPQGDVLLEVTATPKKKKPAPEPEKKKGGGGGGIWLLLLLALAASEKG